jgi:hypothetical protein
MMQLFTGHVLGITIDMFHYDSEARPRILLLHDTADYKQPGPVQNKSVLGV